MRQDNTATSAEGIHNFFWDMSLDLLAIADQRGHFTAVSPSWQRTLGHTPAELMAQPYQEFVHPDDVAATAAVATMLQGSGQASLGFECRYRCADGAYRRLEWTARTSDDGSEIYCVARDVTAIRAAKDHAARYARTLIESVLDPLVTIDANGVIMDVNAATERVTGLHRTALIGSSFTEHFIEPGAARIAYQRAFAEGQVTDFPLTFRHTSGAITHVVYNASVYTDDVDNVAGVIAAARDVTALHLTEAALAEEAKFRLALEYSASAMCLVSPTGEFVHVNTALCEMLGLTPAQLQAATWQQLTHPDDLATDSQLVRDIIEGRRDTYRLRKRYLANDGHVVWGDLSVGTIRNSDGTFRNFVSHIVDVTDEVTAEQSLAEREQLLQVVLDNSSEATTRFDRNLRIEYVNRRMVEMTGIPLDAWQGRNLAEMGYPPKLAESWDAVHTRVFDTGEPTRYEFEADTMQGHRWYETSVATELDAHGNIAHLVTTSRDITDRKAAELELRRLATHDPLTGLANRAGLVSEIGRALSAGRRSGNSTGVLMIDLDRFKNVNDSLGHGFGDSLLQAVAARLESTVRDEDLIARPGGDEFIVVMRDLTDPASAVRAAWRLVEALREPFTVNGSELFETASVGVAIASGDSEADDLIREADTAMYVAKDEGRDRVSVFNEHLRAEIVARVTIESELRHALKRNQLVVWYQPEIELTTGKVIAVEALLRWNHPDGELYTADRFIEVAEETGLILDIGAWVLQEACAQAAHWARHREDRPITVRVNVSALQLAEPGLLDALDRALSTSGADPELLCLEITETALLRETATARDNLVGIRQRGIRIAIDDFGTGYASLAYLRQFTVDVLKIDRSFVYELTSSDRSRRLVAGVIALADALGIAVTAEGVEFQEQAEVLRSLHCPGAQGFLYSKAVPPEQAATLLDRVFAIS